MINISNIINLKDNRRIKVTEFLQWNDKNGSYTDKNCDTESIPRMSYEEAVKYFFVAINEDFYCRISENTLELTYEDFIKFAKEKDIYDETSECLNLLLHNDDPTISFYKSIIQKTNS